MIYTLNNLNIIHLNDIYKPDFPPHIYYIIYSNAYQGYNHVKNHFFDDMPNLYIWKIIYNIKDEPVILIDIANLPRFIIGLWFSFTDIETILETSLILYHYVDRSDGLICL